MSVTEHIQFLSIDEYLDFEQHSDIRHEYIAGIVYAMVGASTLHNLITGCLFSKIHSHISDSKCHVFQSDMKVHVDDFFYYPDVVVTCKKLDPAASSITTPIMITEVLSESTEARDRVEKWLAYQKLQSLSEYILISQKKIQVEVLRREDGNWQKEIYRSADKVRLESIDLTMTIDEIYKDAMEFLK